MNKKIFRRVKNFFISKNIDIRILSLVSICFFFIYSWLAFISPAHYNSPDEQANLFFIQRIARGESISYDEPLNRISPIVHPRSMSIVDGAILPGGFLGIIVYFGIIARIFGIWITPFLIPLMATALPVFFYFLLKQVWGSRVSLCASLLLYIHPAYWYFASRPLFSNMAVIFGLICGLGLIVSAYEKKREFWRFLIGGFLIGFAIMVRPSEVIWIMALCVALIFFYWRLIDLRLREVFFMSIGFFCAVIPIAITSYSLYGSFLLGGYGGGVVTALNPSMETPSILETYARMLFFPFGFAERIILKNAWSYLIAFFAPWSFCFIIGLVFYFRDLRKEFSKKIFTPFIILLIVSLLTVVYYGSWIFNDHPDPSRISIGTSYVRYWLPVYVSMIPFCAYGLLNIFCVLSSITLRFKKKFFFTSAFFVIYGMMIIGILWFSAGLVIWRTDESLMNVAKNILNGRLSTEFVLSYTPENALIIVDYDDKFIFPYRKVTVPFRREYLFDSLSNFLQVSPVYYYGLTLPIIDIEYLNNRKLLERNLSIRAISQFQDKTLYLIELI